MSTAPKIDEAERLRIVEAYEVLDTPSEESFDRITRLAQKLFNVPIALVTILDDKRQHFKSRQGLRGEGAPRDISFCTHAIRNERGLVVPDAQQDTRFAQNPLVTREQHIRFYAGAPLLTSQGVALGSLCIMDRKARSFDGAQVGMLADLAAMVMDELELRRLASRDPLTGLYNRGMFTQLAERALRRARRHDRPMSALILDIDKFKAVNDVYGHDAGDEVIKRVAELCKDTLREHDILGRWGGEEFVVAAPDTDLAQAFLLGERLRLAVEATSIQVGARPFNVTVSIGVTECGPEATSFTQPLARADVALYAAKSNGRNRTEKAAVEKGDSRAAAA